ncbi:hypothetical protein C7R93_27290 [Brevibacillus fortis]|uniref:Tyr recombinase domain-containing protein n=1 Tax=Brevibacillus fortis TaxID=2126352 RepID=A0A2P7UJT9_9BACL|nr:hypothetical protein C7R93_27290 [Brevibacillus fortis]
MENDTKKIFIRVPKNRAFTAEEAKQFLDAAVFDKWNCLFILLLTTGLRPGEALGLKWTYLVDLIYKFNELSLEMERDGRWRNPKLPEVESFTNS